MLQKSGSTTLYWFLIVWTALNLLQGSLTGLHADEAYYWLYSKFLDLGYFDHPPMIAVFIRIGDLLSHSPFGLRLLTVVSSTLSVYVLWLIVRNYYENVKLFILLFSSILVFHVYGFITTPDSPLLLFGILFLYVYQQYIREDKVKWTVLLSFIIAGLLYSKYHGVLLLLFTLFSNLSLVRRPSFWLIIVLSALLFAPHIYWQIEHNFPSVYYHLFDRSARAYRFEYTSDYLLAQIFVAGPLIGWFLYKASISIRTTDPFIRAVKYNFYGILLFFLFSTFKGRVEPHWTLLAFPGVFILSYLYLAGRQAIPVWIEKLAIANIVLILIVRIAFMIPIAGVSEMKAISGFHNSESWAKEIYARAGDHFVIIQGGFQEASLYNFYNNTTKGFAYDTRYYRKTQYDIWPLEDSLRNKPAYYVTYESHGVNSSEDTIRTDKGIFYGRQLPSARTFQKVQISTEPFTDNWKAGGLRSLKVKIINPYNEPISFSNKGVAFNSFLECGFIQMGKVIQFNSVISKISMVTIEPLGSVTIPVIIRAPSRPGEYNLVFSLRTEPFPGSRNSGMIPVKIN